ncbi:putative protein C9orf69 -like [Scophthalmus maximus]|uniref:Transmembrane protein 250 n=2 Tax=Scophthalmus maximus TaxID=52904 RepID=A0A2U9CHZ5_SCOMX|nr:putative protein C9orf69 -like [Scophthalmus maximus]
MTFAVTSSFRKLLQTEYRQDVKHHRLDRRRSRIERLVAGPGPPRAVLGSSSPPMPVIPIPRRVRSFHGPHTTCMHSACGSTHASKLVRTKYNNFDLYVRSRCMYSFLRFLLYFGCSLLTSLLWVALSALFFLQYVSVRVLLRLQYKLSVILLLLGHRRLDFGVVNDLIIYSMQITMFLVGGLGWCFMVFVDM